MFALANEVSFEWTAWFPIPVVIAACLGATAATMYMLKGKMQHAADTKTRETPLEMAVQLLCQAVLSFCISLLATRGITKLANIESIDILIMVGGMLAIVAVPILDKTYADPFWWIRFVLPKGPPPSNPST